MPHIRVGDIELYYQQAGDGPPVLLVHHFFGTVESWAATREPLRRHFQVISVDLRAHGRSSPSPQPFTVDHLVADVAALLRELGISSLHLVGASIGAVICGRLALSEALNARSLTMIGVPRMGRAPRRIESIEQFVEQVFPAVEEEYTHAHRLHGPAYARTVLLQHFLRINRGEVRSWFEGLEGIRCPVLVVSGDNDWTFPPASALELAGRFQESELCVLPRGGHLPHRAAPHITTSVLLDFLLRAERRLQSNEVPASQNVPETPAADEVLGG